MTDVGEDIRLTDVRISDVFDPAKVAPVLHKKFHLTGGLDRIFIKRECTPSAASTTVAMHL